MRLVKDRAAAGVKSTTASACTRDLGPANPASRLAKACALARSRVLARCAALAPNALGLPCSASATSVEQAVDCVLDRQHAQVARLVADEIAAPCALLEGVGAGATLPGVCE